MKLASGRQIYLVEPYLRVARPEEIEVRPRPLVPVAHEWQPPPLYHMWESEVATPSLVGSPPTSFVQGADGGTTQSEDVGLPSVGAMQEALRVESDDFHKSAHFPSVDLEGEYETPRPIQLFKHSQW